MSTNKLEKKPFIICSAIWYNDGKERPHLPHNIKTGIVACGWRHHNCFTVLKELFNREYVGKVTQGFITSQGMFASRKEAAEIAFIAGQISERSNTLLSEDLY